MEPVDNVNAADAAANNNVEYGIVEIPEDYLDFLADEEDEEEKQQQQQQNEKMTWGKPHVKKIKISAKQLETLNETLSRKTDYCQRLAAYRKIYGGMCTICREVPTKKVSYDVGGAVVIERYCDKCFETARFD